MIISNEEKLERAADERVHREHEANDYQNNINRYTSILAKMPTDTLPENLKQYKGVLPEKIPATVSLSDALLIKESDYRDELTVRIRCESVQLANVIRIRDAVDAELPADAADKAVAISAAVLRRTNALAG